MSNSSLEVSKANRANEISELNDLTAEPSSLERSAKHVTKFRLGEMNKIKHYLNSETKRENILLKKLVNTLLLLIMQTNFLLHYLHCLAL